jgi:hypothetical protein
MAARFIPCTHPFKESSFFPLETVSFLSRTCQTLSRNVGIQIKP